MDARLLRYYNQELRYLRELGGEFAREFPKIAARLGMEGLEVADPYVERLLEGSAFLAARVQLKLDAEFPRLSHRLLDMVYPAFLAPQPSMLVARVNPVPDANLLKGHLLPRDSVLMGPATSASQTRCEFRTRQDTVLTPVQTSAADLLLNIADLGVSGLALSQRPRSALRVTLQLPAGMSFQQLELDSLRFYMAGQSDVAMKVHELALSAVVGVMAGAPGAPGVPGARRWLPEAEILPVGYAEDEAMLPATPNAMAGTRLLQEYFAFAERFLFIDVKGLRRAFAATPGNQMELVLLLSQGGQGLEGAVTGENFSLNCVPAINLFPKRADRIHINEGEHEFHVVPDRVAPLDYEVYDVLSLTGYDDAGERRFTPLYAPDRGGGRSSAHYTVRREPRLTSESARRDGPRSGYVGSEIFVTLVDPQEAPYADSLRQVAVQIRCTNRDLPVFLPAGGGLGEFTVDAGVPLQSVRIVAGPSRPFSALREGGVAWRLLNLLSLNYLSLLDTEQGSANAALRDLLGRLPQASETSVRRQIEALQNVSAAPVVRRHPGRGPIAFGRGVQVRLQVDELGHAGGSAFLFGAALHHYLSQHVSMNGFVETVLESLSRGEVARWKPRSGSRPVI
ncbi:type VI secretion system baseplate subunit TssF [Xylophilus rhododendri]|uniref:Type VI secretion system baseplate subunit TssF n=1 Tax=Xylophilus rhododendri TaxID=2697032 RepID=A0A857JAD8_9BURK|nr:type VI secretion system baseplate subunit TssF [Xylophilus rhododendri]QHJ00981.1 type VI secretion system baseplate subunit TssF [Xylophilus rhododendri]